MAVADLLAPPADADSGASRVTRSAEVGSPLAPSAGGERDEAVDVLRGFALFGILPVNIFMFALPQAAGSNPLLHGGTGIHFATWVFTYVVFELKFLTIFTILYGAGLTLMTERAEARGVKFGRIFYRRMFWLLIFGLIHAYFFWPGDILFNYALCGMLLYPLRRLRPRTMILLSLLTLSVSLAVILGIGISRSQQEAAAEKAEARLAAGETLTEQEDRILRDWREQKAEAEAGEEKIREQLEIFRGDYSGIFRERFPIALAMQTVMWLALGVWRTTGLMFLGMALIKLHFLRAASSERVYKATTWIGIGIGGPFVVGGVVQAIVRDFDPLYYWGFGISYNYFGSVPLALGYIAVVLLAFQHGLFAGLRPRLAAVGRMTLTGYLLHSIVLTTVFNGYGLGLFGYIERFYLWGFVVAVWLLQLYLSPLWLRHFRFGPFEWLWRSLTYWRRQPLCRQVA